DPQTPTSEKWINDASIEGGGFWQMPNGEIWHSGAGYTTYAGLPRAAVTEPTTGEFAGPRGEAHQVFSDEIEGGYYWVNPDGSFWHPSLAASTFDWSFIPRATHDSGADAPYDASVFGNAAHAMTIDDPSVVGGWYQINPDGSFSHPNLPGSV